MWKRLTYGTNHLSLHREEAALSERDGGLIVSSYRRRWRWGWRRTCSRTAAWWWVGGTLRTRSTAARCRTDTAPSSSAGPDRTGPNTATQNTRVKLCTSSDSWTLTRNWGPCFPVWPWQTHTLRVIPAHTHTHTHTRTHTHTHTHTHATRLDPINQSSGPGGSGQTVTFSSVWFSRLPLSDSVS